MSDDEHIHGDEVHGDKVEGDKVEGDKLETHINHYYGLPNRQTSKDDLSVEAQEILRFAYTSLSVNTITVAYGGNNTPPFIIAGNQSLEKDKKYHRAVKELYENGLIRQTGFGKPERYELTGLGNKIAKSLGATG